jgi:dTDP-glucose pyrophosphorylase
MKDVEKIFVELGATIEKSVEVIQEGGIGIALVVDRDRKLLGTITDGDIRRAILQKIPLTDSIEKILAQRPPNYPKPTVAAMGTPHEEILALMETKTLRHIPLLDKKGRVVEIALLSELVEEEHHLPITAVIMAGGRGRRLLPLTQDIPKPMLLLDDSPIIERTIKQLKKSGIKDIFISTNFKSEVITQHFGDGSAFGVNIRYLQEDCPLGTAGALGLMDSLPEVTLVINGDILTQLNFRVMYEFHRSHQADITVGVRIYEVEIPFGVIETEDIFIKKLVEKPQQAYIVNAGIYLLNRTVYEWIPHGTRFDMTQLVDACVKNEQKVVSFPIQEYWCDIGQPRDYERAKNDVKNGRV